MPDQSLFLGADGTLLNARSARLDPRKFFDYALNREHARGGHKGTIFEQVLGFRRDNVATLVAAIRAGIETTPAQPRGIDSFGSHFRVDLGLTGPNGRFAIVRTNWIYDPGSSIPRLTSAFVRRRRRGAQTPIS
jgi:filamentous hemagglutinin